MIWPTLDPAIGVPILWGCLGVFVLAVALWVWPDRTKREPPRAPAKSWSELAQALSYQPESGSVLETLREGVLQSELSRLNGNKDRKPRTASTPVWLPLHAALRYLAYETEWSANNAAPANEADFNRVVGGEFMERLARGDIKARGKRGWGNPAQVPRTTEPIPADYWTTAFMLPHNQIVLADDDNCAVGRQGEEGYRCVIIDRHDMETAWPRRLATGALTPLAAFCEPLRRKIEKEKGNEKA